jgi:murein DD-endopeptidase MepM/ murein hydrolase activator NlpD
MRLATLAAVAFPLVVAAVRMGTIVVDRDRYYYYPPRWDSVSRAAAPEAPAEPAPAEERFGVGGVADPVLPLRIMTYSAKPGDTLSGIATAFGLELDTVSSLNRNWGAGVHSVFIGEHIRIPNQNGIYLTLTEKKRLEDLCKENDVLAETVLAANGIRASDAAAGSRLFFPGVQHRGVEAAIVSGTAFFSPVVGWISSGYEVRRDPFGSGAWKAHYGVDFVAAAGTPVRAASEGVVWLTGEDDTFGRQVLIGHKFGFSTFYAHLDRYVVYNGQQVTPQTIIGYVGATGRVTGPHLHFELRSGGAPINPSARIAPRW